MRRATTPEPSHDIAARFNHVSALLDAAGAFVSRERGEAIFRKWLPSGNMPDMPDDAQLAMVADAVLLTADLLLSQPSASGATAFDRLAKARYAQAAGAVVAIASLKQAKFRLLKFVGAVGSLGWMTIDVISTETVNIVAPTLPPLAPGTILFGRVAPLGSAYFGFAGAITPLNAAGTAVAHSHPAAGRPGIADGARWAEAIYAHVVRNGTLDVPGVNRPMGKAAPGDIGPERRSAPGEDEVTALAKTWLALERAEPSAALLQRTRQLANLSNIVNGLGAAEGARERGMPDVAAAFERLLMVQLETVQRRERGGSGDLSLDLIGRAVDNFIATREWPSRVRTLFDTMRKRLDGGRVADDPGFERLMQRIQGLRAKTVAQGCTEQEALSAAEKVAELLDRYGLSLGELEFRAQPCEGIGVQTSRRRAGPIDDCVPAIAEFFDCRVWMERSDQAPLRYVFFGLRGDVAAAQYLYEMVERAFETETDRFRASVLYLEMAGERRTATNSFQIGMAQGIADKLSNMRSARDAVRRSASGRDLVPVKAAMVDEEMAKLGLNLSRTTGRGRRVIDGAFAAGEAAGQRFEFHDAITRAA